MNKLTKIIQVLIVAIIISISFAAQGIGKNMPGDSGSYAYFVVNISDFKHVDLSAAYINKIVDLFKRYNIGVDLYFTEPVLKALSRTHPELIEKIKGYPLAAINYHVRPPHPCDENILRLRGPDGLCRPLDSLDFGYVLKQINEFESHALVVHDYDFKFRNSPYCPHYNPNEVGGFDYVKQVFHTTPIFSGSNALGPAREALMTVLHNKGLKGYVAHHVGGPDKTTVFRTSYGLLERPSDFGFVFSTIAGAPNPYQIFVSRMRSVAGGPRPIFGAVLVHDFDFYDRGVWFDEDMSNRRFGHWQKSAQEQSAFWQAYENLVAAIAADKGIRVVNARDVVTMAEQFFPQR